VNLLGVNIASSEGKDFAIKTLSFMRETLTDFQAETGNIYNLEATPAEGTSYRLARIDKRRYPEIVMANQHQVVTQHAEPFYTNSSQLPVDYEGDLFDALEHQESLQTLYTGGTVFHIFLGERLPSWQSVDTHVQRLPITRIHERRAPQVPSLRRKLRSLQPRRRLPQTSRPVERRQTSRVCHSQNV
jgi:ribonucleoside-triphosphate reductase